MHKLKLNKTMTNTKELFENVVDTHTKALNSFVETASKFQDAFKTGKTFEQTTELYKNWWDTQVALLNNVTTTAKKETENTYSSSVHNVEFGRSNIIKVLQHLYGIVVKMVKGMNAVKGEGY